MPSFAPAFLASWTGGQWTTKPNLPLHGFTQDTRKLRAGQVFVALRTDKRDGHSFLAAAMNAGASAAIVQHPDPELGLPQLVVPDPLRALQVIGREHRLAFRGAVTGVTGSCGKTSTKNLLARLLGGEPLVLATEGNLNNFIGVPLTLTRLEPGGHESAVIEAGISVPGEMEDLGAMIQPDYGIVTMVGPAHLQELGGIDGVAREKSVLLQHIRPGGLGVFPKQCWDFLPFQDLPQPSLVAVPEGEHCIAPRTQSYGLRWTPTRTEAWIGGRRRFDFRRVTRGMAQNAVLGILLASEMGVSDEAIQRGLDEWEPTKWRGELKHDGRRTLYLDFYNANPASMADSLENFCALVPAEEPRLFVLGCMEELGENAALYHRALGRSLKLRRQDQVLVIGTEAQAVREGALESGDTGQNVDVVTSLAPIAARVAAFTGAVFIKGSRRYELEKVVPVTEASGGPGRAGETRPAEMPPATGAPLPGPTAGGAATLPNAMSWTRGPNTMAPLSWHFPRAVSAARSGVNWWR